MKEEYNQFIGIYDESVPIELCKVFVDNWDEAQRNRTIMHPHDVATEIGHYPDQDNLTKQDQTAYVAPLQSTIYPRPPVDQYSGFLKDCFNAYIKEYSIQFNGIIYNDMFKIHKVKESEGFHRWHYEKGGPLAIDRIMAFMTYLEVPKRGGETEFLHQCLRLDPVVGRTLIWPAGYTHMHRGLMPLEGTKMYITGWFTCPKFPFDGTPGDGV
jgi:hypothetical protein